MHKGVRIGGISSIRMRQNTETSETERPTCHAVSVLHEQANGRTILRAHGRIEVAPERERLAHPLPESEPASVASLHEVAVGR